MIQPENYVSVDEKTDPIVPSLPEKVQSDPSPIPSPQIPEKPAAQTIPEVAPITVQILPSTVPGNIATQINSRQQFKRGPITIARRKERPKKVKKVNFLLILTQPTIICAEANNSPQAELEIASVFDTFYLKTGVLLIRSEIFFICFGSVKTCFYFGSEIKILRSWSLLFKVYFSYFL